MGGHGHHSHLFMVLNELAELLIPGMVIDEIAAAFGVE